MSKKKERINFRQERDFGTLFSDTFKFLFQNFKGLLGATLYIVGPYALVVGILTTIALQSIGGLDLSWMNQMESNDVGTEIIEFYIIVYGIIFIYSILLGFGGMLAGAVVYEYIHIYVTTGKEKITPREVWKSTKKHFWLDISSSFMNGVLMFLGYMFCFIPYFYFYVQTAFIIPMRLDKNISYWEAFKRCNKLMKKHFWLSLGFFYLMNMIVSIILQVTVLPQMFGGFAQGFLAIRGDSNIILAILFAVLYIGSYLATFFFQGVHYIAAALRYYSIMEKEEGIGNIAKIQAIGIRQEEDPFEQEDGDY